MTLLLAVLLATVAALALWQLAAARGPWVVKLALVLVVPAIAVAADREIKMRRGLACPCQPPPGAVFDWAVIREPDPQTSDRGAIYLWLTPAGAVEPRAYRIPYSRPTHEQTQRALDGAKAGRRMVVAGTVRQGRRVPRSAVRFSRQPPVLAPRKQR